MIYENGQMQKMLMIIALIVAWIFFFGFFNENFRQFSQRTFARKNSKSERKNVQKHRNNKKIYVGDEWTEWLNKKANELNGCERLLYFDAFPFLS